MEPNDSDDHQLPEAITDTVDDNQALEIELSSDEECNGRMNDILVFIVIKDSNLPLLYVNFCFI